MNISLPSGLAHKLLWRCNEAAADYLLHGATDIVDLFDKGSNHERELGDIEIVRQRERASCLRRNCFGAHSRFSIAPSRAVSVRV